MSFETASNRPLSPQAGTLDFTRRAYLSEMMDAPCAYEELRACLRDLAQVNRITLGYRPTIHWLKQFATHSRASQPLHVVDVGCGGGDMLRRIERWAARKRIAMRLTGIDLNPHGIRASREFTPSHSRIRWFAGDAYAFDTADDPVDLVISSLFTHHLSDDGIICFLQWMEKTARRGWFINDLSRSRASYRGFRLLSTVVFWHRFIRHDGPISIRRAFQPEDWREYLSAAGLTQHGIRIENQWPGRVCVARVKPQ
jgi:SAM-dependent methyltransferase